MRFPQVTQIVSLFETRTPLHVLFAIPYYIFWEFRNSYFQDSILKTIIWAVVKSMKLACETASFHKGCRPVVATLYLLRSPVETAENSCDNNCWKQPTKKFNQNKFYWRCSTKGIEQCNFVKHLSILIARKHNMCPFIEKWVDCTCLLVYNNFVVVSWLVLLSLT